jgi:hypothetical protein
MSKKQNRVQSDAAMEVMLERRDRDERGEPSPEPLFPYNHGPDWHFLEMRVQGIGPEEFEHAWYQAIYDLLDTDIPLSSSTRQLLKGELRRLHCPDLQAEKRQRRLMEATVMGAHLEVEIALKRREGVSRPVDKAKAEVAKHWGRNSGKALDKALQPNRVYRQSRRQPRGEGDAAK